MPVLKWLQSVTKGLFATCERPLFLVFCEQLNDFSNSVCNMLSVLGGDVVTLCDKKPFIDYSLYDGAFLISFKNNYVTIKTTVKRALKLKVYKKTFSKNCFEI
jgi:hypothetical protein